MRLAIFGGTFDPIHEAHLAIARKAADQCHLDRILLVPAAHPPHKSGATHASYNDRFRMAELAFEEDRRVAVSRLEEGAGRSYTIHTIEKVRLGLAPDDQLFFLIGADAFADLRTWYRWQDVTKAVRFIVVSRPGCTYATPPGARVDRLDSVDLAISSSDIRREVAAGERPTGVPERVVEYIFAHGLYGAKAPAA